MVEDSVTATLPSIQKQSRAKAGDSAFARDLGLQRAILASMAVIYPAWSVFLRLFIPYEVDSFTGRLLVGGLAACALGCSFVSRMVRSNLQRIGIGLAYVVTAHFYSLVFQANASIVYIIGAFVISAGGSLFFDSVTGFAVYSLFVLTCVGALFGLTDAPTEQLLMLFGGVLTFHVITALLLSVRVRTLQELSEERIKRYSLEQEIMQRELEQVKTEAEAFKQEAYYDQLTQLPNRRLFQEYLEKAYHMAHRRKKPFGVLFLDLDGFKAVNDTYGHDIGDALLVHFGTVFTQALRKSDFPARMGGDEFTAVLTELREPDDVKVVAERLLEYARVPIDIDGRRCDVGCSIGVAIQPNDAGTFDASEPLELLRRADLAMYEAKHRGKNCWVKYDASLEGNADRSDASRRQPTSDR